MLAESKLQDDIVTASKGERPKCKVTLTGRCEASVHATERIYHLTVVQVFQQLRFLYQKMNIMMKLIRKF